MNRMTAAVVTTGLVAMLATPVLAYHCPALVTECQKTADVVANREGSDAAAVAKARKGCDEALKLHQEGKHRASMIKAGEAIAALGRALNK